ncbi:MAG: hypothetical protein JRI46_00690 [Deltaproteobacteria bacterium]|nr:hypothetical protein [Deltaproteobacteria bacterium]
MDKKFFYFLLVAGLVVFGIVLAGYGKERKGTAKVKVEGSPKIAEVRALRNVIEIKAEGEILHYQKESLWNEEDFSEILGSRKKFESTEVGSFKKNVERYNRYVVDSKVEFNKARKSTTLICDVKGAKAGSWYDFDWFLRPRGLDFIDSHFNRREKELYWEGEINGIRTSISIKFPFLISNCHEHVWPR